MQKSKFKMTMQNSKLTFSLASKNFVRKSRRGEGKSMRAVVVNAKRWA